MPPALTIDIALDAAVLTTTPVAALMETPAAVELIEMGPPDVERTAPTLLVIDRPPPRAEIEMGPLVVVAKAAPPLDVSSIGPALTL